MSQIGTKATAPSGGAVETLTPDSGGPINPSAGNINVLGGNNIVTTGAGSTITIDVNGTTNHAVQVGNASGSLTSIGVGTNGQVLIGATAADPAFATLTSTGGSITFTTGANTLNLEASGGSIPWTEITVDSQPISMNNGYWVNAGDSAYNVTLPTTATAFVDRIYFQTGWSAQHDIYIHCGAGQSIRQGTNSATSFLAITQGTTSSVYVELLCVEDDNVFVITTPCIDVNGSNMVLFIS